MGLSPHTQQKWMCLFNFCADEIRDCFNLGNDAALCHTGAIDFFFENSGVVAEADLSTYGIMAPILECGITHFCNQYQDDRVACQESFADNPACQCAGNEDSKVIEVALDNSIGCFMRDDPAAKEEFYGIRNQYTYCYVKDSDKCPLTNVASDFVGIPPEETAKGDYVFISDQGTGTERYGEIYMKTGCCYENAVPTYAFDVCGGLPDNAPEVSTLSMGFFALNLIPCVAGLVFGGSNQFLRVWKSVKVSGTNGSTSGMTSTA